ncbi:MAG: hypothetical protein A3I89_03175 [Candidatus Harrisonbacteria bacterium RIFCSPLOWO2_02_FULL_41_11]|uniref:PD-(D/E)XK endonuclease-like domain-containing protein n=1 Tax=Candidatus Harrisonbacteria bacterium RIFCSPHIGHO2_02_FULL_42_16 TaxID=1798404 RepID=A0A1G1ZIG2_9BACT|nr:MAG: hypothetical protein A3B92_02665 [Candidatus Harrisonbacteria bacterium RIFCSPHIGHO2_02_FULL_42_16]OGY66240.1 MAG: hypothetical protein A3I89_03175 [Candidatus Harrisonbacteria bacterium RIFCSPLOWO2_02_FULL_41_11]
MYSFKNEESFKELCGYDIDGHWYPRVTKIIDIKSKPALYWFYGEAASYKAAKQITETSAKEGTLIHEISEKIMVGENPEVPETIKPAITAFWEFMNSRNIHVDKELVEKRIFNPQHKYAGTIDALALIDGKFGVLDIKTSQAIYRDYNLQTSAYIEALLTELPSLETRWILRIDQIKKCFSCGSTMRPKGGRNKVRRGKSVPCPAEEHQWSDLTGVVELQEFPFWKDDFEAFLGAKKLWEWENAYWLKKIGYL